MTLTDLRLQKHSFARQKFGFVRSSLHSTWLDLLSYWLLIVQNQSSGLSFDFVGRIHVNQ
jgi:hypothetical protein